MCQLAVSGGTKSVHSLVVLSHSLAGVADQLIARVRVVMVELRVHSYRINLPFGLQLLGNAVCLL